MEKQTKRRLLAIAKKAEALALEIRRLCETPETPPLPSRKLLQGSVADVQIDDLISELKAESREKALSRLQNLSHSQLGMLYRRLGGSSQEAKKPKTMVIDRIMWTLFDFQRGHDILKNGKGSQDNESKAISEPER